MSKKDNEKDSERPHYYSQFWLDVAAGRRIIGAPKEEGESEGENEAPIAPAPIRRASRVQENIQEEIVHPSATLDQEEVAEEEVGDFASNELEEVVDADLPDVDIAEDEEYSEEEEEEEEEDLYDSAEEEEEEEGAEWGARGRKKAKPTRAVKPAKKPRRDTRRGF
ncbi:hypothetical protein KSD_39350 [Ktedonobacter sp. SOSP1-85]|uniref:hypothetical protein n=1 Tax=Ktedonobacter sp. SOSP1-85 TaxID=2778367 RepID=UPI00191667F9|nr:hypothetical protein [Ktedonobacter sp. SOSP1-85]GHO76164.1 hypothetical protein KSD_39350 [Ktedonobacter sp. SOSP1-85]